jgi:hypothetical protein
MSKYMSKILVQLADAEFLVSPDLAAKIQSAADAFNKVVTVTNIEEPKLPRLGSQDKEDSSTFDRCRPPLTDRQRNQAQRIAEAFSRHRSKSQPPPSRRKSDK